jgi:hypothetical protein
LIEKVEALVENDVPAPVISRDHLIKNKLAVGRLQDLADVEKLREAASRKLAGLSPESGAPYSARARNTASLFFSLVLIKMSRPLVARGSECTPTA